MAEDLQHLYEGLFLFPQSVASNLQTAVDQVKNILTRHQAEIVMLRKWDERKLAYPIKGQKRGVYFLAYFKAPGSQLHHIDRDCTLSEQILRALIIRADHVGQAELELAQREVPAAAEAAMRSAGEVKPKAPGRTAEEDVIPSALDVE
jgi:small subunit ribosomal protein S6